MSTQSTDNTKCSTDLDWISKLASALAGAGRGEALQALTELAVARCILVDNVRLSDGEREEALAEEIEERLRSCRSETFAHEMFSMAANNDPDFDQFLFPDGRGEMIFIDDSAIEGHAECLLERYIDYIETYPDYDLIHPSDCSGPKEPDEDKEWARLVWDFSWMLREWRDGFMRKLLEDCARYERTRGASARFPA